MEKGTVLKWKEPQSMAEESERFILIEDNGDRYIVSEVALQHWPIPPQFCYKASDLCEAVEECEACGTAFPEHHAKHLGGMMFCPACAEQARETQKEMDREE